MVREVINIHIGQAGIQIANAAWELFCLEHGVKSSGHIPDDQDLSADEVNGRLTFFEHTPAELYVPRAIFIDTEPTVIDVVRNGPYRSLYNPSNFIAGKEDAANNFARGYYHLGRSLIDSIMFRLRKQTEECENLQGYFVTQSYGGGSGSGLGSLILQQLSEFQNKICTTQLTVYPSLSMSTAVVEPYNCVLTAGTSEEYSDITLLMDNEALYDISHLKLEVDCPTYPQLNKIIAQIYSAATVSMRFTGTINTDLSQLQTNIIPYPRLHYPLIRFSPFISANKAGHIKVTSSVITKEAFSRRNQTVKCDTNRGSYMAVAISYRGNVNPNEVVETIRDIRENAVDARFVDWCPTGFKIGYCYKEPSMSPDSTMVATSMACAMMANTSAMSQTFNRLTAKYAVLHKKQAFVHWFVAEGMEASELSDAGTAVEGIRDDYFEAGLTASELDKLPPKDEK